LIFDPELLRKAYIGEEGSTNHTVDVVFEFDLYFMLAKPSLCSGPSLLICLALEVHIGRCGK
jgi:hypothetical protein